MFSLGNVSVKMYSSCPLACRSAVHVLLCSPGNTGATFRQFMSFLSSHNKTGRRRWHVLLSLAVQLSYAILRANPTALSALLHCTPQFSRPKLISVKSWRRFQDHIRQASNDHLFVQKLRRGRGRFPLEAIALHCCCQFHDRCE